MPRLPYPYLAFEGEFFYANNVPAYKKGQDKREEKG